MKRLRIVLFGVSSALAHFALAQPALTGPVDPLAFSQLKDFTAHRSSSNWPEPDWNDDSRHPSPARPSRSRTFRGPAS